MNQLSLIMSSLISIETSEVRFLMLEEQLHVYDQTPSHNTTCRLSINPESYPVHITIIIAAINMDLLVPTIGHIKHIYGRLNNL